MCLGIPGEITAIDGSEATASFWDVEKTVRIDIVGDDLEVGDYVLNHAGFAIRKIPEAEVEETMAIYEAFLEGDEDEALEEIGAAGADLGLGGRPAPNATDPIEADGETRRAGSPADPDADPVPDADPDADPVPDADPDAGPDADPVPDADTEEGSDGR